MKFEEIEVGEKYRDVHLTLEVKYKQESTKEVVAFDNHNELYIYNGFEYKDWKPLKSKLPETGLIVGDRGDAYIMRTGKSSGYGFRYIGSKEGFVFEESDDWSFYSDPEEWDRPATKEDKKRWKELLTEEARRRGYIKGAKVKCLSYGKVYTLDGGSGLDAHLFSVFCRSTTGSLNVKVLENNKWAKIIPEEGKLSSELFTGKDIKMGDIVYMQYNLYEVHDDSDEDVVFGSDLAGDGTDWNQIKREEVEGLYKQVKFE